MSLPHPSPSTPNEALNVTNQLLAVLVRDADRDWHDALTEVLTEPADLEATSRSVNAALERYALDSPVGVFVGSTGQAKELLGLDGELAQVAITALKGAGRLLQAGRGRGKALVVLNDQPLVEAELPQPDIARVQPAPPRRAASTSGGARATGAQPNPTESEITETEQLCNQVMAGLIQARDAIGVLRARGGAMEGELRALRAQVLELQSSTDSVATAWS